MKKKIYHRMVGMAALTILSMLLLMTVVSFHNYQRQVFEDLKILEELAERRGVEIVGETDIRVTLIAANGNVLYDNQVPIEKMENHLNRPEVQMALEKGSGTSIRESDTMGQATFYYAAKIANGTILRVGREAKSVFSILLRAVPASLLLSILLFGIAVVASSMLTESLLAPIEQMAKELSEKEEDVPADVVCNKRDSIYDELTPFMKTIREQHSEIIKSARMRQEFTANVSHELKTPLTSISGYSELIENGMADQKDTVRFAGEIHKNATRLLTLINDIIKLSQMDVANSSVEFEEVDLYSMTEVTVEMLQMNAEKRRVSLKFDGDHACVKGNHEMLEELIYNLIDNAIRYNRDGGSVTVSVKKIQNNVVFMVADTGIGIPDEHQERIFERFYRVDKSRSKQLGGTGLGLAIVKHIVMLHEASLELKSAENIGTTVRVIFQ